MSKNGPELPSLGAKTALFDTASGVPAANQFQNTLDRIDFAKQLKNASSTDSLEAAYITEDPSVLNNWYKALPYGFIFTPRSGNAIAIYLPISPNNLNITTHFSTHVTPTLYGTVEQHSDQRYFDIVIRGTTGIAPRYTEPLTNKQKPSEATKGSGRASFSVTEAIPSNIIGGFFKKTISTANQILNKAADILNPLKNSSAIDISKTGYAAFHRLYKFFLYYKRDTSGQTSTQKRKYPSIHPLVFINYKDNNKYDCSIQKFTLDRSAENPLLYNYLIVLKAYNLQPINGDPSAQFTLKDRLRELGLDGITNSNVFSKVKQLSKDAKTIFGASEGGLDILGS